MTIKEWTEFTISLLKILVSLPSILFLGGFYFRNEIKSLANRLVKSKILGAEMQFENQEKYLDKMKKLEKSNDPKEQKELIETISNPSKLTPEEGAKLIANDLINQMPDIFNISDINTKFNSLFSKQNNTIDLPIINKFKNLVISNIRSNKLLIEDNRKEGIFFTKISSL